MSKADVVMSEFLQDLRRFERGEKRFKAKDVWTRMYLNLPMDKKEFTEEEAMSLAYYAFELYKRSRGITE